MIKFHGYIRILNLKMIEIEDTYKLEILADDNERNNSNILSLEVWDTAAQYINKNYTKNDHIYVEGVVRNDRWEKNGEMRSKISLRITYFKGDK